MPSWSRPANRLVDHRCRHHEPGDGAGVRARASPAERRDDGDARRTTGATTDDRRHGRRRPTGATTGTTTGGDVSAAADLASTGVLCVPAQTSLTLALTTGLEFAAGQSVVLGEPGADRPDDASGPALLSPARLPDLRRLIVARRRTRTLGARSDVTRASPDRTLTRRAHARCCAHDARRSPGVHRAARTHRRRHHDHARAGSPARGRWARRPCRDAAERARRAHLAGRRAARGRAGEHAATRCPRSRWPSPRDSCSISTATATASSPARRRRSPGCSPATSCAATPAAARSPSSTPCARCTFAYFDADGRARPAIRRAVRRVGITLATRRRPDAHLGHAEPGRHAHHRRRPA